MLDDVMIIENGCVSLSERNATVSCTDAIGKVMEWFSKLFGRSGKAKRDFPNLTRGKDPLELWNKTGELGDGAFGKVYKAENRETGVLAALKRVPIQDETELEDFMVEIDILTECKHPRIVGLHQAFFHDSALWIFIEFCAGGAVDDIIVELDHGLSEPQIRCITHQMLQALECLHACGCIHRDLKAGNILLCPDGSIRLADFGVSARPSKGQQQKKRDTFIGTPYWMAPEVVVCETNKDTPYDQKADIWSTGITLIELADMNPPFHEMSPMRVLLKITRSDPPILEIPHRWSKDFNNFLAKCLTKNPEARPSASELLQHPFVASVSDHKPLRALYQEVKSEVVEVVEELPEDADITTQEEHIETTVGDQEQTVAVPNDVGPEPVQAAEKEATPPPQVTEEVRLSPPGTPEVGPPPVMIPEDPSLPPIELIAPSPAGSTSSSEINTPAATPRREGGGAKGEGYKYGTLSRVRKFKVDGEVIESTTRRIVDMKANKTLRDNKKYQEMRKVDNHQLKRLQREEMKETTEFYHRIKGEREVQEKKVETERQEVERRFETVSEAMVKKHKKEVEKLEQLQLQQFKSKAKNLKSEQTKSLKLYKEQQKDEEKLSLKKLESSLPRGERKLAMQKAKSEALMKRQENERQFSERQVASYERELNDILERHKMDMKSLELSCMTARQDLERNHTNELWEMEQRQKQDRHQMLKQELREAFHMQRHQMQSRHQKEIELQAKRDQFRLDELRQQHLLESRQVPKKLKAEHKQVIAEMRKGRQRKNAENFKEELKRVEEQYQKRARMEMELLGEKHEHELQTLKAELDANMRELQEIQNEKKMMLTQHENNKLKERDEQHTHELREWRSDLTKRRQALEEKFQKQREDHEMFYATFNPRHPLSASLSTPVVDGPERVKAASFSGNSPRPRPPHPNRSSLQPLDEVVVMSSANSSLSSVPASRSRPISNGSNV